MGPHHFQVLGVPILAGRDFDEHDSTGSQPSVIINQTMARFYFGGSDPLGKWIQEDDQCFTIVGVVRDVRETSSRATWDGAFTGQRSVATN